MSTVYPIHRWISVIKSPVHKKFFEPSKAALPNGKEPPQHIKKSLRVHPLEFGCRRQTKPGAPAQTYAKRFAWGEESQGSGLWFRRDGRNRSKADFEVTCAARCSFFDTLSACPCRRGRPVPPPGGPAPRFHRGGSRRPDSSRQSPAAPRSGRRCSCAGRFGR